MTRRLAILMCLMVGLAGCATTLEHPLTHQSATCQSDWPPGDLWIAGAMTPGIGGVVMMLVGDVLSVAEYQKCVDTLKRAGYEEVTPVSTPSETTVGETERTSG